jgi:acyl carrier protein
MTKRQIEEKLKEFIVETFLFGQDSGLKPSDSLLKKGVIDSTGVMELITFIERAFQVKIEDGEILPENLDSIARATSYILRKQNG